MSSLHGQRVLVTRARAQAGDLASRLAARGAVPLLFPTIAIAPLDDYTRLDAALTSLHRYQWIVFTSVNGVAAFWSRLEAAGGASALQGQRLAAIGPATAHALAERGVPADLVPEEHIAEAIVDGLGEVAGQWILLPRAERAREVLADALGQRGAFVHEVPVYRTLPAMPDADAFAALQQGADLLTFTSASAARNFVGALAQAGLPLAPLLARARVACLGPITAQAARQVGLPVHIQAETYTLDGLVAAIERHLAALPAEG